MSFSLLPPSLSSDEEDFSTKLLVDIKSKGVGEHKHNIQEVDYDSSSNDEDCMNEDFEFGGLLVRNSIAFASLTYLDALILFVTRLFMCL